MAWMKESAAEYDVHLAGSLLLWGGGEIYNPVAVNFDTSALPPGGKRSLVSAPSLAKYAKIIKKR